MRLFACFNVFSKNCGGVVALLDLAFVLVMSVAMFIAAAGWVVAEMAREAVGLASYSGPVRRIGYGLHYGAILVIMVAMIEFYFGPFYGWFV